MSDRKTVRLFLEDPLRQSAEKGEHNFINLMVVVLETAQFRVEFCDLDKRQSAPADLSLTHMASPANSEGLVFRRVYHYPFWQIDSVAQRWQWDVARAKFDPANASDDAPRFYRYWQQRLFGDGPQNATRDGFVYVPLQGFLDRRRAFQSCTPLQMIAHCLEHEPTRKIVATLHPNETYSASDLAKLEALADAHPQLEIAKGDMAQLLQTCDFVVTQNSGAAFSGYFFGKPALLFAEIDFHHIAETADMAHLDQSFANAAALTPAYDKYIWWFWQNQSINAGREDARAKIAARLRRFGWQID